MISILSRGAGENDSISLGKYPRTNSLHWDLHHMQQRFRWCFYQLYIDINTHEILRIMCYGKQM